MRKPTAKRPQRKAPGTHKALTPKKPVKAAKPAKAVKAKQPKRPLKAKGASPSQHKLTQFGWRKTAEVQPAPAAFVDLAPDMPPVTDQGAGSCIAHATLAMFGWATSKGYDPARITPLDVHGIQSRLSAGAPIAVGLMVCESFTSAEAMRSGVVTPARRDRVIDGHYLVLVGIGYGYEWAAQFPAADPATRYVKVRNSWGTDAYRGGYLLLPLAYLERHVTELWTIG